MSARVAVLLTYEVWGHVGEECLEHGCPCVVDECVGDECVGDECEEKRHDENRCSCGYDINNVFVGRTFDVASDSESDVRSALERDGYELLGLSFEWQDDGFFVTRESDGRPEMGIRWAGAHDT